VSRLSRQCGILNISQHYRPPLPVTRIALLLFYVKQSFRSRKDKPRDTEEENISLILTVFLVTRCINSYIRGSRIFIQFNTRISKRKLLFQGTSCNKSQSTYLDCRLDNDIIVARERGKLSLSVAMRRNIKRNGSAFNLFLSTGKQLKRMQQHSCGVRLSGNCCLVCVMGLYSSTYISDIETHNTSHQVGLDEIGQIMSMKNMSRRWG
jgi:hypothetical protein